MFGKKSSFTSLFGYLGPIGLWKKILIMLGKFWQSLVQIGLNWTYFKSCFRFDMFFAELTSLGANYSTLRVYDLLYYDLRVNVGNKYEFWSTIDESSILLCALKNANIGGILPPKAASRPRGLGPPGARACQGLSCKDMNLSV